MANQKNHSLRATILNHSLRATILLVVGALFAVFMLVFFIVFQTSTSQILLSTEQEYLYNQLLMTEGSLQTVAENALVISEDIAYWGETISFIQGENPDYFARNWPAETILNTYNYHFVLFQDVNANVVYADYYDESAEDPTLMPSGFAASLAPFTRRVAWQTPSEGSMETRSGITQIGGRPCLIAVAPAWLDGVADRPVGTVTLGIFLSDGFFKSLTYLDGFAYAISALGSGDAIPDYQVNRVDNRTITIHTAFSGLRDAETLVLSITADRTTYQGGQSIMYVSTFILICVVFVFLIFLYLFATRKVLRPLERLSSDIQTLQAGDIVHAEQYANSDEYVKLCASINGMLYRLNESNISINMLQHILNSMDAFLFVSDVKTDEVLFINDKMREHFHIPSSGLGRKCYELLSPNQNGRCAACPLFTLLDHPEKPITWEEYREDTGRYYRNTESLIEWSDNRLVHLHHRVDITESKRAEESLQRRYTQQAIMSDIAQSFISMPDRKSFIQYALRVSGEFMDAGRCHITRLNPETGLVELAYEWHNAEQGLAPIGTNFRPFGAGHPIYDAIISRKAPYVAVDSLAENSAKQGMAKDGVKSFMAFPIVASGKLWGIMNVAILKEVHRWSTSDIHLFSLIVNIIAAAIERNESEQELLRMSSIVNASPNPILFVDANGQFEYLNEGTAAISGYTIEELYAGGMALLLDVDTKKRVFEDLMPEAAAKGKAEFELPILRKDGTRRVLSISAFTIVSDSGELGFGTIGYDITDRLALEEQLVVAKDQAEQSSHAKSDFLSRMSHEMRTPMNAIIGMTHMAKTSTDPEKKEYCLDKIDEASNHLLGVINDILDMSKIEAGKFELSPAEFDFERMLKKISSIITFRVDEKKQNFVIHVAQDVPQNIIADEQRLSQVITNLLSNATKFTPEQGTVTLSIKKADAEGDSVTLHFAVTDTGIGISPEQQLRLFRSFEQADGGISRRFGGTGLGLAISKNIVELMGGRIWVESTEGEGSSFQFTVKVKSGKTQYSKPIILGINLDTLRILAVDDAPDVREYFLNLTKTIGFSCTVAKDGTDACRILEEAAEPFDVAFVDWRMPGMNGIELTKKIKGLAGVPTAVIMISAAEWEEVEAEAKAAGVDRFISKPLFSSTIVDCIIECLSGNRRLTTAKEVESAPAKESYNGFHLLLAEDVEINREIVISLLDGTGITVDTAENGLEAVARFKENPGLYDMIFMDIHMPEMDGYEATRTIRSLNTPEASTVPIVAMTANVFREDIEKCMAAGMNDHIGKPIDLEEFFSKLRKNMRQHGKA